MTSALSGTDFPLLTVTQATRRQCLYQMLTWFMQLSFNGSLICTTFLFEAFHFSSHLRIVQNEHNHDSSDVFTGFLLDPRASESSTEENPSLISAEGRHSIANFLQIEAPQTGKRCLVVTNKIFRSSTNMRFTKSSKLISKTFMSVGEPQPTTTSSVCGRPAQVTSKIGNHLAEQSALNTNFFVPHCVNLLLP